VRKPSVLLAGTDPDLRELIFYLLSRQGFEIIEATEDEALFEFTERHRPDVALLDLPWPPDSRLSFIRNVRQSGDFITLPIIVMLADDRYLADISEAGVSAIAQLPEDVGQLALMISKVAPRQAGVAGGAEALLTGRVEDIQLSAPPRTYEILFLCNRNSARSIIAEYLIRKIGGDLYRPYSAGARPTGRVNPLTLKALREVYGIDACAARSKGVEEFLRKEFDFVITVCDRARESCPVWKGQPTIAHWGIPDPAGAGGTEAQQYERFRRVASLIERRIELFCALPLEKLEKFRLNDLVQRIGDV
jgi:arsenate reductase